MLLCYNFAFNKKYIFTIMEFTLGWDTKNISFTIHWLGKDYGDGSVNKEPASQASGPVSSPRTNPFQALGEEEQTSRFQKSSLTCQPAQLNQWPSGSVTATLTEESHVAPKDTFHTHTLNRLHIYILTPYTNSLNFYVFFKLCISMIVCEYIYDHGNQIPGPLGLGLQVMWAMWQGARNQTQILCKSS